MSHAYHSNRFQCFRSAETSKAGFLWCSRSLCLSVDTSPQSILIHGIQIIIIENRVGYTSMHLAYDEAQFAIQWSVHLAKVLSSVCGVFSCPRQMTNAMTMETAFEKKQRKGMERQIGRIRHIYLLGLHRWSHIASSIWYHVCGLVFYCMGHYVCVLQ